MIELLKTIAHELHERFGIEHTTIQFERCDGRRLPDRARDARAMSSPINKAVLLAAGRGTRMRDLTNELPKPMIEVRGKPILATHHRRAARRRRDAVSHSSSVIAPKSLGKLSRDGARFGVSINYATQVVQDGTGKVVELARDFAGIDPFVLSYGDIIVDPANYPRLTTLEEDTAAIISVKRNEDVSQGGAVFVNERFELIDLREKPQPGEPTSPWYNAGIYAFRPSIFDFTARLATFAPRRIRADRRDPRPRPLRQKSAGARAKRRLGGRARPEILAQTQSLG